MKGEVTVSAHERERERKGKGAKPLKKLSNRHRQILALLLQGHSNNDVARMFNMTPSRVSIIRNDPLVQEVMGVHIRDADAQLGALLPSAVDTLKDAMECGDMKNRLRAAENVLKTQGKFKDEGSKDPSLTAEDVVRQIIEVRGEARITLERGVSAERSSGGGFEYSERGGGLECSEEVEPHGYAPGQGGLVVGTYEGEVDVD